MPSRTHLAELKGPDAEAFAALKSLEIPLHELNQLVSIIVGWADAQNFYWPDSTQDDDTNREHGNQVGRLLFAIDEIAKRAADVNERFHEAFKPYGRGLAMTAPTRRGALTALANSAALAFPAVAVAAGSSAESEEPATAEQWAAMNFEPLTIDETPTYEEWQAMAESHAVTLRIARMTLTKTKDEVKEIFRKMDDPLMQDLFERLESAEKTFGHFRWVVECALTRLMVAGSAVELEEGT